MKTLAPGKAILSGEFAVLHGAPAISVATDRCVRAWIGQGTALSPFLVAALDRVAQVIEASGQRAPELKQSGHVGVDSTALYDGAKKLGLGSSAAVTVAVVGAALHKYGWSFDDRQKIFEIADEAHAAAQGTRGSGVDVATSVWGGAIRFQRKGGAVDITPVELPANVQLTFVFTGNSASTPELLGRVKALAESQPKLHEAAIARLVAGAYAFDAAVTERDAPSLLRAGNEYHAAMAHLGECAGCDIVTQEHATLSTLARRNAGAAKPSGAGGGDLGVAFTVGDEATRALHQDLISAGLSPLAVSAPAPGLRMESP